MTNTKQAHTPTPLRSAINERGVDMATIAALTARVAELEAVLRDVAVPALMKVCIVRTDQLNPAHYYDEMDSVADKCHRALAGARAALAKG